MKYQNGIKESANNVFIENVVIKKEQYLELLQAIENLINRNKELEEKVNKYEKQIDLEWVEENYIEKSKVREKIEELEQELLGE